MYCLMSGWPSEIALMHGDSKPTREFVVMLEIEIVWQDRHSEYSGHDQGRPGWVNFSLISQQS